jgi:ATP-dependent DNA ligase
MVSCMRTRPSRPLTTSSPPPEVVSCCRPSSLVWEGTVLDGELTAGRFAGTMSALLGSKRYRPDLRFVVFDVPVLLGTDLRGLPWHERRERLELLAGAFDVPLELSPS